MTAAERTKRDILQALLRLVDTTPFEHVTVKDICQEAGVSRPTFYAYYRAKYDCAVYLVTRQTADVFGRLGQSTDWRSAYLATFESAQEVQPALAKLTQVEDYNSIFNTTVRASREHFTEAYRRKFGVSPGPLVAFQIERFSVTASATTDDWIQHGCNPCAEVFVDYFVTLIPRELYEAFARVEPDSA